MQRLLGDDLWPELSAQARKAGSRRAAIAYATVDHLGLSEGDQLVVDASVLAIQSGETSAKLLGTLHRKGVELYSRPGLHAKVALLDGVAFVGSANLSTSSATRLDEAGLLTDHAGTVASVQALLSHWIRTSQRLTPKRIEELAKLPVSPRRGPAMATGVRVRKELVQGERVWVVGVRELPEDAHPDEKAAVEEGVKRAKKLRHHRRSELSWVRWTGNRGFGVECRPGDVVFQVQKALDRKRLYVLNPATVLAIEQESNCRRIHLEDFPGRMPEEMTLLQFQGLLSRLGIHRQVGPGSNRILPLDVDAVVSAWRKWTSRGRK